MDFGANIFGGTKQITIPNECKVVFVSDNFVEDYVGGAELTSEALIQSSPFLVFKLRSKEVTVKNLEQGHDKFWVFGNFSQMDYKLIPTIVANMKYSIVEYDYKFCRYRSPEKHLEIEKTECDCQDHVHGKLVSALYQGAKSLWWMSETQMDLYHKRFPFLADRPNVVLSSVFDEDFFLNMKVLRSKYENNRSEKWIVIGSNSWVKGVSDAEDYCKENNLEYELVWGIPYQECLDKLASSKGLVFLPKGGDTCPRLVIEAKLLGCELVLNENVQHKNEFWFNTDNLEDTESYLYAARDRFWNALKNDMSFSGTLSGYTTTKDCIEQNYPWRECIKSLLGFCDEVVVVDGGSKDGTWEELVGWSEKEAKLIIHQEARDWSHERFAVFDGLQKALARSICTGDFCWQQDCDEVVHENDYDKVRGICDNFPNNIDLIAMPIIEYWGGTEKVRADVYPWKWRISRNKPHITHGIPANLRRFDESGHVYSLPGSDGCDYIRSDDFNVVPCGSFYTQDVDNVRQQVNVNLEAKLSYQTWYNQVVNAFPPVYHFSWWDLERKIKTYRDYWGKHWKSLYNEGKEDTPENNMMFDCAWSEVDEEMIKLRAAEMKNKLGGWIWHKKWNGEDTTEHITCEKSMPEVMNQWTNQK
jgi:glycosyltransferase involved in cell wall biosynthesis